MQGMSVSKVVSNKMKKVTHRKFLKILRLENLSGEARLQIVFQGFKVLLKNEAWRVMVVQ